MNCDKTFFDKKIWVQIIPSTLFFLQKDFFNVAFACWSLTCLEESWRDSGVKMFNKMWNQVELLAFFCFFSKPQISPYFLARQNIQEIWKSFYILVVPWLVRVSKYCRWSVICLCKSCLTLRTIWKGCIQVICYFFPFLPRVVDPPTSPPRLIVSPAFPTYFWILIFLMNSVF